MSCYPQKQGLSRHFGCLGSPYFLCLTAILTATGTDASPFGAWKERKSLRINLIIKKEIKKASVCKRLVNPDDCNPKCVMGYTFMLDGERYQKCRYMAFQPALSEENNPYIMEFLEKELRAGAHLA